MTLLAACDGKEPVADVEPAAPPTAEELTSSGVTAADIEMSWTGEALQAGLRASDMISATPSDAGMLIQRIAEGEETTIGVTSGARLFSTLPNAGDTSGVSLTVEFSARVVDADSGVLRVAYSTNRKGNSGWIAFDLTGEFATYDFAYTINEGEDPNVDVVGFTLDEGTIVEISEVNIR